MVEGKGHRVDSGEILVVEKVLLTGQPSAVATEIGGQRPDDRIEDRYRRDRDPSTAFLEQLAAQYARITGRDLSRLGYYMAFGCFKLAVVLEGIHARFLQRKTVGEGFEREGKVVPVLIERAHEMLDAAR